MPPDRRHPVHRRRHFPPAAIQPPPRRFSGRIDRPRTDAVRRELLSALSELGVTRASTLVADADAMSFAGFDLRRWLGDAEPARAPRQFGVPKVDAVTARIEDGALLCRGTLAGGADFGCSANGGWLRVYDMQIEILASFRGPLREMVDNPLLAMREYRVTSGDVFAGTTLLRFECPVLPLATLPLRG